MTQTYWQKVPFIRHEQVFQTPKGKTRLPMPCHQRMSLPPLQCFLCMDIETWWSQVPSTLQGFICMNWPAWGTLVYGWREEFVIASEWKTGEETITKRVMSYLHSTLTLSFAPLERTGRIRTRNGKECFSKRLDGSESTRMGLFVQYLAVAGCA